MGFRSDYRSCVRAARFRVPTPARRPIRARGPRPLHSGAPRTRPLASGAPEARTRARSVAAPSSRPRGGARSCARSIRGGPRVFEARPARPSLAGPQSGPPHFLSRREGGRRHSAGQPSLPSACCAPWRPPRGRALGTRGSLSGPPFPGSGPAAGGGLSPLSAPIRAPRAEPSPLSTPEPQALPSRRCAHPSLCESARLGSRGVSFLPGVPLPLRSGFPAQGEKNAACTHLFILQQLQETMKLFKKRGNALPSRAVVFNEPLGHRTARPPRSLRASPPQPAPVPSPARRRGHCFWSPAGGKGACRVAGAVRVGATACERARAGARARAGGVWGGRRRRLAASHPTPRLRSARPCDPGLRVLARAGRGAPRLRRWRLPGARGRVCSGPLRARASPQCVAAAAAAAAARRG